MLGETKIGQNGRFPPHLTFFNFIIRMIINELHPANNVRRVQHTGESWVFLFPFQEFMRGSVQVQAQKPVLGQAPTEGETRE